MLLATAVTGFQAAEGWRGIAASGLAALHWGDVCRPGSV
jgi:hypothetical protein